MSIELRITFHGLCMFVQRETPKGLFVLLPDLSDHAGMEHCAVLEVNPKYVKAGKWRTDLSGLEADLSGLAQGSGVVHPLPWVANTFKYTGKKVADGFLAGTPAKPLAARIHLPLGTLPTPLGDRARLKADNLPADYVAGRSRIDLSVDVPNNELSIQGIPGLTLKADDGEIQIAIRNEPPGDIASPAPPQYPYSRGQRADHLTHGYYSLLVDQPTKPPIEVDEDRTGTPGNPGGTCKQVFAAQPTAIRSLLGTMGVDPARCGNGGGD